MEYNNRSIPTLEEAMKMLKEAEDLNPGPGLNLQ